MCNRNKREELSVSLSVAGTMEEVGAIRDEIVIAVWTDSLPREVENQLKAERTADGTFFSELTGLHNQYMTALTVFAKAGITRPTNASEPSTAQKLRAIEIAKSMVTGHAA